MAFTEQDLETQKQKLTEMKERLSRMKAEHDRIKKESGYTDEQLRSCLENLSPKAQEFVTQSKNMIMEDAKRVSEQRLAQSSLNQPTTSSRVGNGRKNIVRI